MKKTGIIIGVLLILIAIILFVVSKKIEQRNIDKLNQPEQTEQTEVPKLEQPAPTQPKVVEKIVETEVVKEVIKSQIVTIEENTLGTATEKEEIVVIATKRLILLDEGFDTNEDKMLTYCFDVLTSSNKELTLFMTDVTYRQFEVGDKLKVKYKVYTNNKGVEFPVTVSVNTVE